MVKCEGSEKDSAKDIAETCHNLGMGLLPWNPLAGGCGEICGEIVEEKPVTETCRNGLLPWSLLAGGHVTCCVCHKHHAFMHGSGFLSVTCCLTSACPDDGLWTVEWPTHPPASRHSALPVV